MVLCHVPFDGCGLLVSSTLHRCNMQLSSCQLECIHLLTKEKVFGDFLKLQTKVATQQSLLVRHCPQMLFTGNTDSNTHMRVKMPNFTTYVHTCHRRPPGRASNQAKFLLQAAHAVPQTCISATWVQTGYAAAPFRQNQLATPTARVAAKLGRPSCMISTGCQARWRVVLMCKMLPLLQASTLLQ